MRSLLIPSTLLLALAVLLAAWDLAAGWLLGAVFLLLLGGAVLLSYRLLDLRPEAVVLAVGLASIFIIGFAQALADGDRHWMAWPGEAITFWFALLIATVLLAGWFGSRGWAAPVACAMFIPLSWIAADLGASTAYLTGWRGLEFDTFGSHDQPGLANSALIFAIYTPLWSFYAVMAGVVGWVINTFRPRGAAPSAGASPLLSPPSGDSQPTLPRDEQGDRRSIGRSARRRFAG